MKPYFRRHGSGEKLLHDISGDISQAEIPAQEAVRQLDVIEAH